MIITVILILYSIVISIYALSRYIGILALVWYMQEKNIKIPNDEELEHYTKKVCRKLFHVAN